MVGGYECPRSFGSRGGSALEGGLLNGPLRQCAYAASTEGKRKTAMIVHRHGLFPHREMSHFAPLAPLVGMMLQRVLRVDVDG